MSNRKARKGARKGLKRMIAEIRLAREITEKLRKKSRANS